MWQNVNDWVADFQRGTDFNPVDKDEYVNIATGFDATGNINRILGYQKRLWLLRGDNASPPTAEMETSTISLVSVLSRVYAILSTSL
jgi:hypothetical protein